MNSIRRLGERVAGLADFRGTTGDWGAEGQRILDMEYEDWLSDKVVFGTPDDAIEKINGLRERLDLDQIMFEINYGNLIPFDLQTKSLKLITQEVLPTADERGYGEITIPQRARSNRDDAGDLDPG